MNWFDYLDSTGYSLYGDLPGDCINECSASGAAAAAVDYWVTALKFDAPEGRARDYLRATGAWDDDELRDHDANVRRLLWLIACDHAEAR